jgi:hypothetical protein
MLGLVYRGLRRSTGPLLSILGSAGIFAIVHPPIAVVPVFVMGCVAALSFEKTGVLLAPVLVRAATAVQNRDLCELRAPHTCVISCIAPVRKILNGSNDHCVTPARSPSGHGAHGVSARRPAGGGAFGIIYLARDTHLDKDVAIKEYLPSAFAARPQTAMSLRSHNSRRGTIAGTWSASARRRALWRDSVIRSSCA